MNFARRATALLALGAWAAVGGCDRSDAPEQNQAAQAPEKGVDRSHAGRLAPETELRNAEDETDSLRELAGEPVLVNLWATWCAPCVKELPTLDALSKRSGAPRVIAVSQDMGPRPSVDAFLQSHKLHALEGWHDPQMALSEALGAEVLPTTIYYDKQGREVWRYVGDLDWNGEEAARLLAEARGGSG